MPTIPRVYISTYNIKYLAFTSHNIFLILISAFYPLSGPHMWEQVLYPELPGILAYVRTAKPCPLSFARLRSPHNDFTVPIRLSSGGLYTFHSFWRLYHP